MKVKSNFFKNFFKGCDIFPNNFEFTVKEGGPIKTVTGGIMSAWTVFIFSFLIVYSFSNFFNKRSISVINEIQYEPMKESVENISVNDFQFFFTFWDITNKEIIPLNSSTTNINSSLLFTSSFQFQNSSSSQSGNLNTCSKPSTSDPLIESLKNKYTASQLESFLCSNFTDREVKLGGNVFSGMTYFLDLSINIDICISYPKYCQNTSNIPLVKLYFVYMNKFVNTTDYDSFTKYLDIQSLSFSKGKSTSIKGNLIKNLIDTDDGLFYGFSSRTSHFFSIDFMTPEITDLNSSSAETSFNFHFEVPLYFRRVTRVYSKLDSVFSIINAFYSFLFMFARVLLSVLNYSNTNIHIIKKLYLSTSKQSIRTNKKLLTKFNKDNVKVASKTSHIQAENGDQINIISMNNRRGSRVCLDKLAFKKRACNYMYYKLCLTCSKNVGDEQRNYLIGKFFLDYDLNIVVILSKLIALEKLIQLKCDQNEIEQFKQFSKRIIDFDSIEMISSFEQSKAMFS